MSESNNTIVTVSWADELVFVDKDIRDVFEKANYAQGVPSQIQLAREIRKSSELIAKLLNEMGVK